MHKKSWTFQILGIIALLASVLVTVRAQNDADTEMVSEEMTIDDAVNVDLGGAAEAEPFLETESTDLGAAIGTDLTLPEETTAATEEAPLETLSETADAAADLGTLETSEPVMAEEPLAVLDEAPVEEPLAIVPESELATDSGLEALSVAEEPVLEAAPVADELSVSDDLGTLQVDAEKGVPAVAAEDVAPVADDLSGLEMSSEPAATESDVAGMEAAMDAVEGGMAPGLVGEESSVSDSLSGVGEPMAVDSFDAAPAVEPAAESDLSAVEAGVAAGAVATDAAVEQTPVTEPVVSAAPPKRGRARQPVSEQDKAVQMLREGEELRRRAFVEHANEKLALADEAFKKRDYVSAQRYYEQAANALDQAGGRPENRTELKRAKDGALESLYRRAGELRADGDYENARKLATDASLQGHPKAAALVQKIDEDMKAPPAKPEGEKPRWKQDDYIKKSEDVKDKLHRGRQHFMANELDQAQDQFEAVLDVDPHNTEAIRWREKVTQTRFERASMELETTRQDMMSQVRETWNPRDYGAGEQQESKPTPETEVKPGLTQADIITKKMESITISEIDFRQANINDVVQFLQEQSIEGDPEHKGVNIILKLSGLAGGAAAPVDAGFGGDFGAPEGDTGSAGNTELITFRAREISVLDALKIVCNVANLKYRIQGNVVMIVDFDAADQDIVHRMYPVLPSVGERITALRESTGGTDTGGDFTALGGGGSVASDAGTDWKAFFSDLGVKWPIGSSIKHVPAIGQLMVANTPDNLAVFERVLAALNIVPKQIEIEARFVEVNQTDLTSLGLEWLLTDDWEMLTKEGDANLPMAARQRVIMPKTDMTQGNRFVTDSAGNEEAPEGLANATDGILSIASVLTNPELSVILHALEQKGHADLLSAPKVTTQSGIEAQIKVVTEYIYPSDYTIEPGIQPSLNSDGSVRAAGTPPVVTPAEFETREVGVILTVLPEVSTEGEMINLTMSPEVVTEPTWKNYGQSFTDALGNVLQIPIEQPFFHSRSISTSILIYNGATVVMGGMITEDRQQVDDRIPFLGDIPLLGHLFRSTYDHSVKKNLLIFVTARLVDPAGRAVGSASTQPMDVGGALVNPAAPAN